MKENKTATPNATNTKKKYITLKFLLILAVSALTGGAIGALVRAISDNAGSVYAKFEQWLIIVLPATQWVWLALSALASILFYLAARTAIFAYERGGSENEATATRAEQLLSGGMITNQLCMIIGYGLFGVASALPYSINMGLLGSVACVFIIIVFYSVYCRVAVKLLKRLNPEKQGDPLDFHFNRDWISSCDEAELMGIYQAAYASYKVTNTALLAVWLVTVIIGVFGSIGIYPIVIVTIIWLVHTLTYQLHALRNINNKLDR